MMKRLLLLTGILLVSACSPATDSPDDAAAPSSMDHSDHMGDSTSEASAMDRLNDSPRHQEWVEVKRGGKTIYTWVVYPERSEKAPVVLLIHENRGLNDWARGMADQVAEAGSIAVAPDLLSGFDQTHKRTSDFADEDAARTAIGQLKPEEVSADLQAVVDWAKTIDASNGKIVSAGFCWGGAQSFQLASASADLSAAMVFYGTGPTDPAAYERIKAPVYGFYGGADERVNATVPQSKERMGAAGKTYEPVTYAGAGHAFMRLGEDPNGEPANVAARNAAWERMKGILESL
jgi:carboxymethylenebutenolidase